MYSSIVIVMAIACVSAAPGVLDSPAEVISAPFTNPTVLAVQNSQIFLRNYKAIPSRIVSPAAFTLPNGLPAIAPVVTDGITRLNPVLPAASPLKITAPLVEQIETPVPVTADLKTAEPKVVAAPVESNLVETLPAIAAPLSLPVAKQVAAPLTSAISVPISAPLVRNAPFLSAPYIASPYISSPYISSPYVASPYIASPYTSAYTSQYISQNVL